MIYLLFGVIPVHAYSASLFVRLIPFLLVSQALFFIVGRGPRTWRGQQYSLALFPIWIKAVTSAFNSVYRGRDLAFAVTPKTRQARSGSNWRLVWYQLLVATGLIVSMVVGTARFATGHGGLVATVVNLIWAAYTCSYLA